MGAAFEKVGYQPKLAESILKVDKKEELKDILSGIGFGERNALIKDLDKLADKALKNEPTPSLGEKILRLVGLGTPPDAPFKKIKEALPDAKAAYENTKKDGKNGNQHKDESQYKKSIRAPTYRDHVLVFEEAGKSYQAAAKAFSEVRENFNGAKDIMPRLQEAKKVLEKAAQKLDVARDSFEVASAKVDSIAKKSAGIYLDPTSSQYQKDFAMRLIDGAVRMNPTPNKMAEKEAASSGKIKENKESVNKSVGSPIVHGLSLINKKGAETSDNKSQTSSIKAGSHRPGSRSGGE